MKLFILTVLFLPNLSFSETRVTNPDGTITITWEPGEREALLRAAEERRDAELQARFDAAAASLTPEQRVLVGQEDRVNRSIRTCTTVTAKHYRTGENKSFERCVFGLINGAAPPGPWEFYEGSSRFSGLVVEKDGGFVYYNQNETTTFTSSEQEQISVDTASSPDSINCGNPQRRSKYQCLVCNCFHEARGQSFEEQVMVNRVVLSRVLSRAHPSNVCDVVFEGSQFTWTQENQRDVENKHAVPKKSIPLNETSPVFQQYYPNEVNALRSCRRSSLEALRYENEFFAAYYVEKNTRTPPWLKTCKSRSRSGETNISPEENRISRDNLAHNFYRICVRKENICINYPTCSRAPTRADRPVRRPVSFGESVN